MYRAYGLLQPHSDFTLEAAVARLAVPFPGLVSKREGKRIEIAADGWNVNLFLNDGPEVSAESVAIAERIAGLADGADIESCNRRVEVWSETPDPVLEHFGKYQQAIEALRSFKGLIAVDPKEPALL